jgi:hypothetical protein
MCYRITSEPATAVRRRWPHDKQVRYSRFEQEAFAIAARHGVSVRALADALFLFHDLQPLFAWSEGDDFMPVFCTTYGIGR